MKEAWAANIPYTIAELDYQRSLVNTNTLNGYYAAVLVRFQDKELADKLLLQARIEQKAASVG